MFQVTDLDPSPFRMHMTFIAVLARRGCRKINYSVMPAAFAGLDERIAPRDVPLYIRRAAKAFLLPATL